MYFLSITFTSTKPSKLNKFILLQKRPFWPCLNQLSS